MVVLKDYDDIPIYAENHIRVDIKIMALVMRTMKRGMKELGD